MLLYIGVCYAAIKVAVQFKAVIATIALLPVAMSMACNYAYDPTVIAFSLLGCSLFITEMSRPDKLMDWKRGALMLAAFCIASFPKAVYIPMILLLLFLPRLFGVWGTWLSVPISQILIAAVSIFLVLREKQPVPSGRGNAG